VSTSAFAGYVLRTGKNRDYHAISERDSSRITGDLGAAAMSLREQREIESLGRKFAKLKERDRGLVRLLVAKLAQTTP
jgi:hypothetical protein